MSTPSEGPGRGAGTAVVLGGGVGGLLAAHVLVDAFERVIVVERDEVVEAGPRKGVAQSRCPHMLMGGGLEAFDQIAPGWRDLALLRGARPFDILGDVELRLAGGWMVRESFGLEIYGCTRNLLESVLVDSASRLPRVEFARSTEVEGLYLCDEPSTLGVRLRSRDTHEARRIEPDLLLDTSGVGSVLPRWLLDLGYDAPTEVVFESPLRYISQWFQLEAKDALGCAFMSLAPQPGSGRRSAMILEVEGGLFGVILLSGAGEELPRESGALLREVAQLAGGRLDAFCSSAVPASTLHRYGRTRTRRRVYEELERWPSNLVSLGDAVCAIDPYFGLGMTQCARGVLALRAWLATESRDSSEFQTMLAKSYAPTWRYATGTTLMGTELPVDEKVAKDMLAANSDASAARRMVSMFHALDEQRGAVSW